MSSPPPLPPFLAPPAAASHLYKQNSWSPDSHRDEAWLRQKGRHKRRSRSVTNEDLDELKACLELGFDFDSPEMDKRLSETFPAYGLYYAVNKQYSNAVSGTLSPCSAALSDGGASSQSIICLGNNPQTVKTRLRQWAQVVACTVHQVSK